MKIGVLTYHYTNSYGATLQTYATCKILGELGHQVEIIDFRLEQELSVFRKIAFYFKRRNTFKLWNRIYPPFSSYYPDLVSLKNTNLDYDCILVGSDQTWNPTINKDRCLAFFLDFGSDKTKRISFASSFGVSVWPKEYKNLIPRIKELLNRFDAISVREKSGKKLINDVFGVNAQVVLDPTLLYDDFSELSGNIKPNRRLITFIMNRSKDQIDRVLELGHYYGKKPVMTSTILPYKGFIYQYPPSISKWLKNVGGAEFVVVDSFHALVFCLKYKKQFVVITPDNGRNSRLVDLLHIVGLENRFYYDTDLTIPFEKLIKEKIDYSIVDEKLHVERIKSIDFLKKNLES